jgi:flagellar assembly protein FliH
MGLIKSQNAPVAMAPFSMKDIENHARAILLRARRQAEQLLAHAQAAGEALKKAAREEGFAVGRVEGVAKGLEDGRKSGHDAALGEHRANLSALVQSLTNAASSLEKSRLALEADGLCEVIELSAAISRRVTKRQGLIEADVLIANLTEAMKLVSHKSDIRIALNPSQKTTLLAELPNLQMTWPHLKHVELIEDAAIAPGGCRVHTTHGMIDATLDTQLDRVIAELLPTTEEI